MASKDTSPPSKEAPKQRPPVSLNGADWRYSDAKHLIVQDMLDGLVAYDKPIKNVERLFNQMYKHQKEFADFPFDLERYKSRIARLQGVVKQMKWSADKDRIALDQARNKYGTPTHDPIGRPVWRGSEAAKQLDEDMAKGLHTTMKPGELWKSNPIYHDFSKARFSKRIDQKKEGAKPYGENPMQTAAKRAKKEKKARGKVKARPDISRAGQEGVQPYQNVD